MKVVLNTKGNLDEVSDEVKELLRYLDAGVVSGEASQALDAAVNEVKNSEERRREYMVMMAREMEIREEGREEGAVLFGALVTKLLKLGRTDDIQQAASDADYRSKLYKEFKLA